MKKIAVIGTGIMGRGIASNFLKNGYQVIIWNRSKAKLENLVDQGAVLAKSPKEAAERADLIFEVTANDQSSKFVWLNNDGIIAGANSNKILITSATLSIDWTDKLAKLSRDKHLTFFDMPMTGGRVGAETGKLIFLIGGQKNKLATIDKDLQAIAEKRLYFGKVGSGMRFKLLLNMLQGIHVVALGEVLNIAKKEGLDIKTVGNTLAERPGGIPTGMAWAGYQKEPNPINFSVEWITKDLNYAKKLAGKIKTPLLNQTLIKYRKAISKQMGNNDWTAVNKIEK